MLLHVLHDVVTAAAPMETTFLARTTYYPNKRFRKLAIGREPAATPDLFSKEEVLGGANVSASRDREAEAMIFVPGPVESCS